MLNSNRLYSIAFKMFVLGFVLYGLYLSFFVPDFEIEGLPAISFFTTQSNILVAMALVYLITEPRHGRFRSFIRGSVMLYILITGLVFHVLLIPAYPELFADGVKFRYHLTHTIAPVGFILDWLLFERKGLMCCRDFKYWFVYPLLYWSGTVIAGRFSGVYPYFFMDINSIGLAFALFWLLFLMALFIPLGLLLIWLDNKIGS